MKIEHHDVLSPLVKPHHCIIAEIIYEGRSEPLERLASVFLTAPLSNVECMCCRETNDETPMAKKGINIMQNILTNCDCIHSEEEEVNSIKQFIWD